jgi:tRNA pseudouridine32 synthase/23S rRNA pseudouridine746 synthase
MPIKDMSPEEMRPEQMSSEAMTPEAITPEAILGRVLHRDGLMLVLDKPAGLPVHRGPKGGGSLEDWFDHLRYGLPRAPALAHRLDKDTSGCLVLGRHRKALAHLGLLFKHGKVGKTYWAVVEGGPDKEEGVIDLALARLDESRGWWMKPDPKGLPSVTTWKVLGRSGHVGSGVGSSGVGGSGVRESGVAGATSPTSPLTWLALTPVTGRTHQLRVHCAAMGWPILGDNIYGTAPRFGGPVMHLHARAITVPLSKNKPPVRVVAPVPKHMRERLAACGWSAREQSAEENDDSLQPVTS